jgi:thiamine biosynthesis lipoprotein ApbE
MMVLGPEEGWNLAVERDLAVLLVIYTDDGLVERMTPSFQAFLDRAID